MIYSINLLKKKKAELIDTFEHVLEVKRHHKRQRSQKAFNGFSDEADENMKLINDKIKQLNRSIDILSQFVQ